MRQLVSFGTAYVGAIASGEVMTKETHGRKKQEDTMITVVSYLRKSIPDIDGAHVPRMWTERIIHHCEARIVTAGCVSSYGTESGQAMI